MIIDSKILKAIVLAAARKDMRYYLNGVLINARHIVATDGARMHAHKHGQDWGHGDIIVPIDKMELALKMKTKQIKIEKDSINGIPFGTIDGKFPDLTRVIPQNPKTTEGEIMANINPEFLLDACKAVKLVTGAKAYPVLANTGSNKWVWSSEQFVVVVMGINEKVNPPSLETFR